MGLDLESKVLIKSKSNGSAIGNGYQTFVSKNQPVGLDWKNLNVFVKNKGQVKQILDNVSGRVEPGQMLAIMGASGAGKSTLLDTLVGRYNSKIYQVSGSITYYSHQTGAEVSKVLRADEIAYVYQDDLFIQTLTPEEHLTFTAKFIFQKEKTKEEIFVIVDDLLKKMRLSKCRHTKIGDPSGQKGLSGGEKKRLSFAVAMIRKPRLLFADEPTTGLDTNCSYDVVRFLSEVGTSVICTIHQPSSEAFDFFEQILLLGEGGKVAFFGSRFDGLEFFRGLGNPCPDTWNKADFFVHSVAITPHREEVSRQKLREICDKFQVFQNQKQRSDEHVDTKNELLLVDRGNVSKSICSAFFTELFLVTKRAWIESLRNPQFHRTRFFHKLYVGIFIAAIFSWIDITQPTQYTVQSLQGVFFTYICECSYPSLYTFLREFPSKLPMSKREIGSGFYRPSTLYLGTMMSFIPGVIIETLVTTAIFYFILGLQKLSVYGFFVTFAVGAICSFVSTGLGSIFGLLFSEYPTLSGSGVSVATTLITSVSGFYLNPRTFPVYVAWFRFLSWFYYSFRILSIVHWSLVGEISGCTKEFSAGCFNSGREVLEYYGMELSTLSVDIAGYLSLILIYHAIAFSLLKLKLRF